MEYVVVRIYIPTRIATKCMSMSIMKLLLHSSGH